MRCQNPACMDKGRAAKVGDWIAWGMGALGGKFSLLRMHWSPYLDTVMPS